MFWENLAKLVSTTVMWVFLGLVSIFVVAGVGPAGHSIPEDSILPITITPLILALIGTLVIWVAPDLVKSDREKTRTPMQEKDLEKAKRLGRPPREERLALLADLMDEDEREAFKEVLKRRVLEDARYDDGELPYSDETLNSLMRGEGAERRRR